MSQLKGPWINCGKAVDSLLEKPGDLSCKSSGKAGDIQGSADDANASVYAGDSTRSGPILHQRFIYRKAKPHGAHEVVRVTGERLQQEV
jgi:hypothetical protein